MVASSRDELRAVFEALQQLPEIDRAALLLRAHEGLSYAEIAATLDLTVAAARVKVHRARMRLIEWRTARSQPTMRITRDVISDVWPVYAANEASADTRALVEDFLSGDQEFARTLRTEVDLPSVAVSPDDEQERKALTRTRDLVRGGRGLRGLRLVALVLTLFTIKRLFTECRVGAAAHGLHRGRDDGDRGVDRVRAAAALVPAARVARVTRIAIASVIQEERRPPCRMMPRKAQSSSRWSACARRTPKQACRRRR